MLKMKKLSLTILLSCTLIVISSEINGKVKFIMDERYVCTVKTSCKQCLKLPHCSWCATENKCFSKALYAFKEYCSNNTIEHHNYGLSLEGNAACSCSHEEMEQHCYPPGVSTGPVCSDRGQCVCGRCVCNMLYPNEPTKMVMGEYCEFDNFSCKGPKCNEGPYSVSGPNGEESKIENDVPVS